MKISRPIFSILALAVVLYSSIHAQDGGGSNLGQSNIGPGMKAVAPPNAPPSVSMPPAGGAGSASLGAFAPSSPQEIPFQAQFLQSQQNVQQQGVTSGFVPDPSLPQFQQAQIFGPQQGVVEGGQQALENGQFYQFQQPAGAPMMQYPGQAGFYPGDAGAPFPAQMMSQPAVEQMPYQEQVDPSFYQGGAAPAAAPSPNAFY